jgi:hypothetical protein
MDRAHAHCPPHSAAPDVVLFRGDVLQHQIVLQLLLLDSFICRTTELFAPTVARPAQASPKGLLYDLTLFTGHRCCLPISYSYFDLTQKIYYLLGACFRLSAISNSF